jgi:hypothetical protein
LRGGRDALGNNLKVQAAPECDDGAHDRRVIRILIDIGNDSRRFKASRNSDSHHNASDAPLISRVRAAYVNIEVNAAAAMHGIAKSVRDITMLRTSNSAQLRLWAQ